MEVLIKLEVYKIVAQMAKRLSEQGSKGPRLSLAGVRKTKGFSW